MSKLKITWFKIMQWLSMIFMIVEDKKIDKNEEDAIVNELAPYIATLYSKQDKPVEEWAFVR